jgi:hexosaminidase
MIKLSLFFFLYFISCLFALGQEHNTRIIPDPAFYEQTKGNYFLNDSTVILAAENDPTAILLRDQLQSRYKIQCRITLHYPPFHHFIALLSTISDERSSQEGYQLTVTRKGITIQGNGSAGIFYGVQSLLQLLPDTSATTVKLPCLRIIDTPRFSWRGMHLDCVRHFFTVQEVKRYLDMMSLYKLNTFHWHLTDEQGWRIEIKRYPRLTTIGSVRAQTLVGKLSKNKKYDGKPYGGYYTQEQIKEVVEYASKLHITIVPEIEMPGHSLAALAAHPELSCTGGPFKVGDTWGAYDDVFCPGKDTTFAFLQNVLDEVMDLFPGKYIHVGGDECSKRRWKECPDCNSRMTSHKLESLEQLQSYFIKRIGEHITLRGRKMIGWDEILDGGLAPNATVMSWRGIKGGIAAARQGHEVVMSPGKPCYFDHYQSRDRSKEPVAIGGYNPVDSVYLFEPVPAVLDVGQAQLILGVQGNLWTEYIKTFRHVEYMVMPRMCALAEVGWTAGGNSNLSGFRRRLKSQEALFIRMKINYAKHALN